MSSRIKIILTCTHSLGAKFLEGQLSYLRNKGFEVYVLSAPGKEIENLCLREEANLISFPFQREISIINDLKAVFRLIKIIRKINPDVINAGTPKAGFLVCLSARIIGFSPLIFTLRGLRSETLSGFKRKLVRAMETFTCTLADIVIPISPSLKDHAITNKILKREKAVVLERGSSNGVNVNKFKRVFSAFERENLRRKFKIGKNDVVFSYVGRINNDKGIPELFTMFKDVNKKFQNVKLLLVGEFELEDSIPLELKQELEYHDSVIIIPYQQNIKDVYEIIDVLVLYSKREGFGNILIEAASMEIPVIASNIPGCMDAVKNNYNGFLVNNDLELKEKLLCYSNDEDLRLNHGNNGRIWAEQNFRCEKIWDSQIELYKKLINKK
ncbi:glycosyltransferase family 4 protein [Sphingobacterium sp.]|uniref:glycosyltransferase family 4 protein n=1 Tax=Sphingobacterium sp. TaxID=341027 RepID=UPI0028A16E51|nr:glycosyltransferase family 4 protein [Sphingobacterium sp.]